MKVQFKLSVFFILIIQLHTVSANIKSYTKTLAVAETFILRDDDSLRPPVNLAASSIVTEGIPTFKLQWQIPDTAYQIGKLTENNTPLLTGFNIYRSSYYAFPAGADTAFDINNFILIDSTIAQTTEYHDKNLPVDTLNCFSYFVKAVYGTRESSPGNLDWECVFIPLNTDDLTVYPNPSTSNIHIKTNEGISVITIFNVSGRTISEIALHSETNYTYYFEGIESGMYGIRVTSITGKTYSQKFLKF